MVIVADMPPAQAEPSTESGFSTQSSGVTYYNVHLSQNYAGSRKDPRLPEMQAPEPHQRTRSQEEYQIPDYAAAPIPRSTSVEVQNYSCSPPGDPKRSRSMDYVQNEALPCFTAPQAPPIRAGDWAERLRSRLS